MISLDTVEVWGASPHMRPILFSSTHAGLVDSRDSSPNPFRPLHLCYKAEPVFGRIARLPVAISACKESRGEKKRRPMTPVSLSMRMVAGYREIVEKK